MNVQEWQDWFNEKFPDGALVTFLPEGSSEATAPYDGVQDLFARFAVTDASDDTPTIEFASLETGRPFIRDIDSVDQRDYGYYAECSDGSHLMLASNLTEDQKQFIQQVSAEF